jgi:MOSC domain-containing protein YiiM
MSETPAASEGDQERRIDDLAAARREIPRPLAGSAGLVSSINVSHPGGVPKRPVDRTTITIRGLIGDGQRTKEPVHGGPEKAVCLFGVEQIARVNADGHHLYPGAIGENLTVSGLDLGGLREGDRLRIGPAESGPIIQLSEPAAPCKNIAGSFEDWRIARVSHKVRPEDSRWYARVLREGPVVTGDRIELLGAADTIGQ